MSSKKQKDAGLLVSKPYLKVPNGLWLSPEFNALTPHSRCIYMLMLAKLDPYRPERVFSFTYDELQGITRFNRHRLSSCITELDVDGWIIIQKGGRFPHRVSLYRINLKPLHKKYPKVRRTLPDYLSDFV